MKTKLAIILLILALTCPVIAAPPSPPAGTPSDLKIASQAAGDIIYFNGTNWVRLAKDAGKFLQSGADAVAWATAAGTGDFMADGSVPFVYEGTADDYETTVAFTDPTTIDKTITFPNATGTVTVAPTTTTAGQVFIGTTTAGLGAWSSTLTATLDDSAAQFKHADSTAAVRVLIDGSMADKTMTLATVHTDNRTITLPDATGTVALQSNEKLAVFNWDGGGSAVATASSKRCTLFPAGATIVGVYAIADASTTSHLHVYQDAYAAGARSTTVTGAVDIGATLGSLDTTLTGWDKSITAADEICMSVEANDNAKWLNVIVYGTR